MSAKSLIGNAETATPFTQYTPKELARLAAWRNWNSGFALLAEIHRDIDPIIQAQDSLWISHHAGFSQFDSI